MNRKINIPSAEPEPKDLNMVTMPILDNTEVPQKHPPCLMCGHEEYEWGHTEGLMKEHYKPGVPKGLLAGGDFIKVRRCLGCNNLQLFHAHVE